MSDAGLEPREWRFYVNDMIQFAEKVQRFTDGIVAGLETDRGSGGIGNNYLEDRPTR